MLSLTLWFVWSGKYWAVLLTACVMVSTMKVLRCNGEHLLLPCTLE